MKILNDAKKWIENLPIKSRLLYGYFATIFLVILPGSLLIYLSVNSTLFNNIERELSTKVALLKRLTETASHQAVKNHIKSIADQNLQLLISIYQQNIPEKEAKKRSLAILKDIVVGKSGYISVVTSEGIIVSHPNSSRIGTEISLEKQKHPLSGKKHGFYQYTWHESTNNQKHNQQAAFLNYFGPWDWIISPILYLDEIDDFFTTEHIRSALLSTRFNYSGYAFIMNSQGTLLVHPHFEGKNILHARDSSGKQFISEMCTNKKGKIRYHWEAPGENTSRSQLTYYDYIPELDWIVAVSFYDEEFKKPLKTLQLLLFTGLLLVVLFLSFFAVIVSQTITRPIKYLRSGLQAAADGNFTKRLSPRSSDELGQLENYFNTFISQVHDSNTRLHESEKSFRSIFENSLEGIFQFNIDGAILKVNPSFVSMLGYDSSETILVGEINFHRDLIVKKELWNMLLEHIISDRAVKGLELQLYKKSKTIFWGLLNARAIIDDGNDRVLHVEGFLSDITAKKEAEVAQEKLMEDLEVMVQKRTAELSHRISELEHRNKLSRLMGEMGDMLQSCRSIEETFPVIKQYLHLLFPSDNSVLYIHDSSKHMIDQVIPPPVEFTPYISMTNDSCWALRQGKTYLFTPDMDNELTCDHIEESSHGYVCIPLIAQGETMGLLHITFSDSMTSSENDVFSHSLERKRRICSRLADHLALALANLNLREKLKLKSIQDSLTGLANRRHMEEILQRQFFRLLRHNTPCSIIMLDVDHFKQFNDTYGHDIGDFVLKELACYLKENSRGEDLACRYGGEEFIIILADTDETQASKKAEKVRKGIEESISIPFHTEHLTITVSIGVATSPQHGKNVTELIKSADKALYRAKEKGRNRVEIAE